MHEPRFCTGCDREQPGCQLHTDQSAWVDYQKVRLQQPREEAVDGATSYLDVHLTRDLVGRLEGGQRATITGRYVPVPTGRTVYDERVHGVAASTDWTAHSSGW